MRQPIIVSEHCWGNRNEQRPGSQHSPAGEDQQAGIRRAAGGRPVDSGYAQSIDERPAQQAMRPTPLEVRTAAFRRVRRGYDPAEVDSLLQRVAERYEAMWRDRQELEQKSLELEEAIRRLEQDDVLLTQALASAQATADRIRAEAQAEADQLRADARRDADLVRAQIVRRLQEFARELGADDRLDGTIRPTLRELVLATIEALDRDGRGWPREEVS